MKTVLLTYSNEAYEKSKRKCVWTAKHIAGFDKVISTNPSFLDKDFIKENEAILSFKRGAGLWLWKPYIIFKTLCELDDGDFLFYCDAGACFVRSIWPIINSIKQDVWCCDIPTIEEEFTKEECFAYMDCDSVQYRKTNQRIATFMCFRKTQDSVAFVKEWLKLCKTFQLISPAESIRYKDHILYSHREDQSIFSLLTKKQGIQSHKIPTTSYYFPYLEQWEGCTVRPPLHDDKYGITIFLHKKKDVSFLSVLFHYVYIRLPYSIMKFLRFNKSSR